MPAKRTSPRNQGPSPSSPASSPPLLNAALVAAALGYGLLLLVDRREISWPPRELLSGLDTLAGAMAMVGPLILWRRGGGEGGLGELTWMVGGLIVWIFDLIALAEGDVSGRDWATPLEPSVLGPIALAVMLAGWRTGRSLGGWSWTNVAGWLLGLVWIGVGLISLLPRRGAMLTLS